MVETDQNVVVVSGTANSGQAVVRQVASGGGNVVFSYNSNETLAEDLLSEIDGDGHRAVQTDVTDAASVENLVDEAVDTLGEIDAVVYTVGVISRATIEETDDESWQNHLDANVTGAFNVLKALAPVFKDQGHGAIAALSASDGIMRSDQLAAYDASKQGLIALVQEAARELGPHGVRANVVTPGYIRDPSALSEDQRQDLLDNQPYKQITSPSDIADACLYLCSDDAATITGAVLPVDSGLAL